MKDFNFSDYLIPATMLIGPATTLYTYFRKEKTGDKDKDKLINENKKLKRNRLSNIVYGNLGYITSILAAYGYWQNRTSLKSHVASLKNMISILQGDNSDNSAKLERLQEDYVTLQERMQSELTRSEILSNQLTSNMITRSLLPQEMRNSMAELTDDFIGENPDMGEMFMSIVTGNNPSEVHNALEASTTVRTDPVQEAQEGKGILNDWLPALGLVPIIAVLSQQPRHFTNLLNESFKGVYERLNTSGLSIGLTSGDIARLIFDGQIYNNYIDLFGLMNNSTENVLNTTNFQNISSDIKDRIQSRKKNLRKTADNRLNRFENIKRLEKTRPNKFKEIENNLDRFTSPPPDLHSMGSPMNHHWVPVTTPFLVPSEMRELVVTNKKLRNLPSQITTDKNRSLINKKKLLREELTNARNMNMPFDVRVKLEDKLNSLENYYSETLGPQPADDILNMINIASESFLGINVGDNYTNQTKPIHERAYYRNLKRFNEDDIFKRYRELPEQSESLEELESWKDYLHSKGFRFRNS